MEKLVLGLDTSCYTTSAALCGEDGSIVRFARKLLPVELGERGLRQSDAVFVHVRQLPQIMEELMSGLDRQSFELAAVCASASPRDEESSYMPVFSVGLGLGRSIASAMALPLYETSHQQGHIEAGLIGNTRPKKPFCALHLSGGTTELLHYENGSVRLLGGSRDLHAGQLLDRIGVKLGFRFPAGAEVERLALAFQGSTRGVIPVSMEEGGLYCHLSGAENSALRLLQDGCSKEEAAAELFDFLSRCICRMAVAAQKESGCEELLIVGGVASSLLLRKLIQSRLNKMKIPLHLLFGKKQYSADNAAGVARIGMMKWQKEAGLCPQF